MALERATDHVAEHAPPGAARTTHATSVRISARVSASVRVSARPWVSAARVPSAARARDGSSGSRRSVATTTCRRACAAHAGCRRDARVDAADVPIRVEHRAAGARARSDACACVRAASASVSRAFTSASCKHRPDRDARIHASAVGDCAAACGGTRCTNAERAAADVRAAGVVSAASPGVHLDRTTTDVRAAGVSCSRDQRAATGSWLRRSAGRARWRRLPGSNRWRTAAIASRALSRARGRVSGIPKSAAATREIGGRAIPRLDLGRTYCR